MMMMMMKLKPFSLLLFFLSLVLFLLSHKSRGLTIDLIHRDYSPLSPFHNSTMTHQDHLQNAAFRSVSRSKRLIRHLHDHHQTKTNNLVPIDDGSYMLRIYLGTPRVETWAMADTGSDLFWLQCLPCVKCYPQDIPLFDPSKSTTFKTVSCHSKHCTLLPQGHDCGKSNQCVYYYGYVDGTRSVGELATDVINFGGETVSFHESVFGCAYKNIGEFSRAGSGSVGLGNGPFSLISQMGPKIGYKFSYCLVPFFSNSTSKLKLGDQADISRSNGVVSTPFVTINADPYYLLNLQGITLLLSLFSFQFSCLVQIHFFFLVAIM